jgi:hypothetical protein
MLEAMMKLKRLLANLVRHDEGDVTGWAVIAIHN